MDRPESNKLKNWRKTALVAVGVLGFGTAVALITPKWLSKGSEQAASTEAKPGFLAKTMGSYLNAWKSMQDKAESIRKAEHENEKLKLEVANLRMQAEAYRFNCSVKEASRKTEDLSQALKSQTGYKLGRTLASIGYEVPSHLLPPELYTLAISYFKAKEFEKAAVILTMLTDASQEPTYKAPREWLLTGMAWYHLDNYHLADQFFDRAIGSPRKKENLKYQAQARLWKGLVSQRQGNNKQAQHWMRDLLDHHPRSKEAEWVNSSKEAGRALSSDPSSDSHDDEIDHHDE